MPYESLYKLKYSQPGQYESIYQTRFNDPETIHLDFNIHDNPAFIYPTLEMMQLIIKIHKTDKQVRALRNQLPGVAIQQFTNRCLVDEIVLTNDIEGVNSTRHEIREVIEKLENKYKCNIMHLVDDMPALSVMLTIIQAAMLPWEHGVKYDDILNLFDKYVEEGGSQIDLYKNVVIPTLAVSGFFAPKMAAEILEATDEEL